MHDFHTPTVRYRRFQIITCIVLSLLRFNLRLESKQMYIVKMKLKYIT